MENCPAWFLLPPRLPLREQHFCLAKLGDDFLGLYHVLTIISSLYWLDRSPPLAQAAFGGGPHYSLLPH